MISKEDSEPNDKIENEENQYDLLKESEEILLNLKQLKSINDANYKCALFKYLDKHAILKFICPFLGFKDFIALRSTSHLLNSTICSLPHFLISKYFPHSSKHNSKTDLLQSSKYNKNDSTVPSSNISSSFNSPSPSISLVSPSPPINSSLDVEDLLAKMSSLTTVNDFLKKKLQESEIVIKAYKDDIESLHNEAKSREEVITRLKENIEENRKGKISLEEENRECKEKLKEVSRSLEESTSQYEKKIDEIRKENEGLKNDKTKLTAGFVQLKKITDDLKRKNTSKAEALVSLKNFFMNQTLLKLSQFNEFSNEYKDKKDNNEKIENKQDQKEIKEDKK